jgi:hypothetical protein
MRNMRLLHLRLVSHRIGVLETYCLISSVVMMSHVNRSNEP